MAKKTTAVNAANQPAQIIQFQVVSERDGREWTMYALDKEGNLWCRYWIESKLDPTTRYLRGSWGEWMPLSKDTRA